MDSATLIRSARRRAGLSQRDLGQRAATSAAAISLYESGQRVPRVDTLGRVLAAAGATLILDVVDEHSLDAVENADVLVQVLDLSEHFPFRTTRELQAPVFAALAQ